MDAAYWDGIQVEMRGLAALLPFVRRRAYMGRFVFLGNGPLGRMMQTTVGDLVYNTSEREFRNVEVKVEMSNGHGNLFLETWSNKNFEPRRPGWMFTSYADELWYYFLKEDALYILDFRRLFEWAHGGPGQKGRLQDFPERVQGKREQKNVTCGRCVPVEVLLREVGYEFVQPRRAAGLQMSLGIEK